ncbi:MAG: hypothetical protein P8Y61_04630 [Gammaproteobacteria bacterium]
MTSKRLISVSALLAGSVLLAACTTRTQDTWVGARPANAPYRNILVTAVSWTEEMRVDMEELLTDDLTSGNTRALSSYRIEAARQRRYQSKEHVLELVRDTNADALLVVWMVDKTVQEALTQSKAYVDYGPEVTVYDIKETPQLIVANTDTRMEAVLYDVTDHTRPVFTIDIEEKHRENGGDANWVIATDIAAAINKDLRRAALVE